jgi:hypothetical protein
LSGGKFTNYAVKFKGVIFDFERAVKGWVNVLRLTTGLVRPVVKILRIKNNNFRLPKENHAEESPIINRRIQSRRRACSHKGTRLNRVLPTCVPRPEEIVSVAKVDEIILKLKNAAKNQVPVGYQDETGFHLGVAPIRGKIQWPPVW